MEKKRLTFLKTAGLCLLAAAVYYFVSRSHSGDLNLLCYIGYDEPEFIGQFTKETGIKVNVKTFFGGDEMYSLLSGAKNTYDVVVVDPEYLQKLVKDHRLKGLPDSVIEAENYYEEFRGHSAGKVDRVQYGVVVRFGVNGLVYNSKYITADEASSYQVLWNKKVEGHIGLVDWYLLSMGGVSKALGNSDPYDINDKQFEVLSKTLRELKPKLSGIYSVPDMFAELANEKCWVLPCGGESVAYPLRNMPWIVWTVPKEGGVYWTEALAIPVDSPNPATAEIFLRWAQKAAPQALLATRKAYASSVPNKEAYALMSKETRSILQTDSQEKVTKLLSHLTQRKLPANAGRWANEWEEFKAGK